MKTTLYKLTDKNGKTRAGQANELQWGSGVTHTAQGKKPELCTDGLIHGYEDPLIAAFMDPIHGNYGAEARLWECETESEVVREGQLKCGVRTLTVVREIELPKPTTEQRVKFAIYCAAAAQGIDL